MALYVDAILAASDQGYRNATAAVPFRKLSIAVFVARPPRRVRLNHHLDPLVLWFAKSWRQDQSLRVSSGLYENGYRIWSVALDMTIPALRTRTGKTKIAPRGPGDVRMSDEPE